MIPGIGHQYQKLDPVPGGRRGETYNLTGTLDGLTLLDETVGTEEHNTDLAGLEVHAHTLNTGGEPRHPVSFPECQDFFG